jgi:hypothetical protein
MVLVEGSCACPQFMKWNGRACVGTGGINKSKPGDEANGPRPVPATTRSCPDGFIGTPPNCCPRGTEFRNGACRGPQSPPPTPKPCPDGFIGTPPNCCPRGTEFRNGACRGPKAPTEIGCPRGTRFENGKCRRPQAEPAKCPTGMNGTFPNCCPRGTRFENGKCKSRGDGTGTPPQQQRPFEKTCPDGTKVFGQFTQCPNDRPQLPTQPQSCPRNRPNGTFPNCCPRQMQFRNGQCVDDKCRQGMVGTPPNCACPPGTTFRNDRCRAPEQQQPRPQPAPTPQQPQQPKCGPGFSVVNGQCVCPRSKEVIQGQCINKIQ